MYDSFLSDADHLGSPGRLFVASVLLIIQSSPEFATCLRAPRLREEIREISTVDVAFFGIVSVRPSHRTYVAERTNQLRNPQGGQALSEVETIFLVLMQ